MAESLPPTVTPAHYRILAAVGLGLVCLAQYWQRLEFLDAACAALGIWLILFPNPRMPLAFVVTVCGLQVYVHRENNTLMFMDRFMMFEPTELILCGGLMLYVAALYRLIAIECSIIPTEGKARPKPSDASHASIPAARPANSMAPDEILRLVTAAPLWVLVGQLIWGWLCQNWTVEGSYPRFMQFSFIVWLAVVGLLIMSSFVGYWRQAHGDADLARMYLQEVEWRESRRDYGRIGKWLAWGKAKARKKWGKKL